MHIDHVVLAARSRRDAERALTEAGLGVARGRELPGLGLSNLVVPLGDALLEVHYPDGRTPDAAAPPLLRIDRAALEADPEEPLVPVAWIVAYEREDELRDLASTNDAPIHESPAEGPGFPPYVLAGFGATFDRPWLPALIHWPVPPAQRPAALAADHRRHPTGIQRLDVDGPADDIAAWCGGHPPALRCGPGHRGPRAVTVGFADGGSTVFGAEGAG
ncbi:VOC family protein [Nitriliruptor alkaliphilus]|uniref:VOC family protein n=1 Tax=Nitriliruptor alkaliphilus TaxID=427918 RepID=UPI0006978498|nr:VOC family protein [Nitriliruptor alkaliphilus]